MDVNEQLVGNGPSKAEIVRDPTGYIFVKKHFPSSEEDRLLKESYKMGYLYVIESESGLFSVPAVWGIDKTNLCYSMDYIPNAKSLGEALATMDTREAARRIFSIIDTISAQDPDGNRNDPSNVDALWNAMVHKFAAAKTNDANRAEYVALLDQLPDHVPSLPLGYSHGDFTFDNCLVGQDGMWWLIDPVWSAVESPIWDIGKILQSTAANWESIKTTGKAATRPKWLEDLNNVLISGFELICQPSDMLLGLTCQLARVSRWCFAEELVRLATQLLTVYVESGGDNGQCASAMRRII
jgi:hypothetical protein